MCLSLPFFKSPTELFYVLYQSTSDVFCWEYTLLYFFFLRTTNKAQIHQTNNLRRPQIKQIMKGTLIKSRAKRKTPSKPFSKTSKMVVIVCARLGKMMSNFSPKYGIKIHLRSLHLNIREHLMCCFCTKCLYLFVPSGLRKVGYGSYFCTHCVHNGWNYSTHRKLRYEEFCKSKDDFHTYSYMFESLHHIYSILSNF